MHQVGILNKLIFFFLNSACILMLELVSELSPSYYNFI